VVSATLGFCFLAAEHRLDVDLLIALVGGGFIVAVVGFIDDHRSLPAGVRLAMHALGAAWAIFWVGGLPPVRIGIDTVHLGWVGDVLGVLGIAWTLNLFNFMDGIDGIAASEAVFVGIGGVLVALVNGATPGTIGVDLVFAAACGGFLVYNWPPARIFMGDVGSGFVGFVIAVLALGTLRKDPSAVWVWLLLGAVFFVDATVTLVRRVARGERVQQAHRSHAYQWLARRWKSHRRVTLTTLGVNILWCLPCAILATRFPVYAPLIVALAFLPLVGAVTLAGAGRPERLP
jgi:Fuc2NAc and GlcNAc transferase